MGNIRSVALPTFAKDFIMEKIDTDYSAPRLDYGFVPGLDVRPEFFDYIPPRIKRRMGVQDDG